MSKLPNLSKMTTNDDADCKIKVYVPYEAFRLNKYEPGLSMDDFKPGVQTSSKKLFIALAEDANFTNWVFANDAKHGPIFLPVASGKLYFANGRSEPYMV